MATSKKKQMSPVEAAAAAAAAAAAGFNFEAEDWEPPPPKLRKQRADFYGPLTQEMLDRAMGGEDGSATSSARPTAAALISKGKKALQHESVTLRAKGRWGKSIGRAKLNVKVGAAMKSLALDKWFVSWQEKNCVELPPVYKKRPGEEDPDAPEGGAGGDGEEDGEIDFGADDSEEEELDEDGLPVKKKNEEGHDSDGNSLPDDDDDLLPTGSASRPGTAGTAGTEGSDAGSLGSARDDAAAQAFAIGDEVVLNKRLKKKKVIGDVLLPSQLCTVTYGPDDKGDMKIERKSDGKVLRYVRPKDIEHTRAATGSPGLNGPVNGPERQGRASRGSGRFSAGSNGIASVQEAMDEALAEVGADGKSPSSSAAGRVTAGGLIVDGKPLTSGILDKRGMLLKIRPSTMAATVKVEPETVGMRLFCFPWEGANTGIFEHFSHLVKTALVVAVQYPGRMNRAKEMPRDDVRFLARGAVEAMRGQKLLDTPYAFLGHGVGALIAYECARIIRNDLKSAGVKPPALFIAVQAEGPQAFDDDHGGEALHEEPDDVLSQHVLTLERGCLPAEVTEQPALFALALPLFRNDTKAYETFRYESDWPFNATPFYVLLGEYDGRYGRDTVQLWDQETTKEFELRILPSGAREMFRDPILTAETAAWVDSKIDFELKRPIDPDAGLLSDPNAV